MNDNFHYFLKVSELVDQHGSVYLPEAFDWAKQIGQSLPKLALDLPVVEKRAKIEMVMDKRNPIYVQLADGSKLFFTHDEFRRIPGTPVRGKTMVVTMQRHNTDTSEAPSQIISCRVEN
jgi:hypothetical protein